MLHFDANPITSGYLEGFNNAKYNMKQRNLYIVLAIISKTTSPTSDSFLLILSHINKFVLTWGTGTQQQYLLLHTCFVGVRCGRILFVLVFCMSVLKSKVKYKSVQWIRARKSVMGSIYACIPKFDFDPMNKPANAKRHTQGKSVCSLRYMMMSLPRVK